MTSLARVYDDHAQALFGFVWNWTHSDAETRDVIQDVFAKLTAKPTILEGVSFPRAFLIQMARHRLLDRERQKQRRSLREASLTQEESLFADVEDPDATFFRNSLELSLAELPQLQRSVLYRKLWEELTFSQIADTLDILPNTAASRYRLGLAKLREQLRPLYEEIQP
ncbi:MAG: RNA polymerase sigma-70 factor (ECF subfamily) [Verrucomicrobiales bacterium]|jgi:RNA polymerase sigma-70 factor (ECF subfamily)